jgi:hypothetical protein
MKLHDAILMGRFCGLRTVDECVLNIELHSMSLFVYTDIAKEEEELHKELDAYKKGTLKLDWEAINTEVAKQHKEYEEYCAKHYAEEIDVPTPIEF